jgi:tripartite-type tricarboxylate transporter receptor subunit TctC
MTMTRPITRKAFLSLAAMGPPLLPAIAAAQARQLRMVLPYAPGGVVDTLGRVLGTGLAEPLGATVVADNRPGAGGMIGTENVARSAPDGNTALVMDPAIVINPTLQQNVPYDLFRDLATVTIFSSSPLVAVVSPDLPVRTMQDLIAYARANPGRISFGSAGVGTTPHLSGELLKQRSGVDMQHVPYRGITAAFPDIMSRQVTFAFSSIAGARGLIADGRLRAIATTGAARPAALRDVPTVAESGLADFVVDLWLGLFVPAATPAPVIASLNQAVQAVLRRPETAAAFERAGAEVRHMTPTDAAAVVRAEFDMWRALITTARITLS